MIPPHDPKLKEAAEEIKAILNKHDIMGSMLLVSPSHVEYLFHLNASWSVMRFEPVPDNSSRTFLRFRSKKADFPDKKTQDFHTNSTIHAVTSFLQFGKMTQKNMEEMLALIRKHATVVYETWDLNE
jgi:hypothetical protein